MEVRVRREIVVWMGLSHDNIVRLLGTIKNPDYPFIGMVSDWMDNGNLADFIVEGLALPHRLQITCDVAAGLAYLHSKDVIHGDLTSGNVLIDATGRARLVDFGLSSIMAAFENTSFLTLTIGGALRFRALEISPPLHGSPEDFHPTLTTACDIYSLGSVTLQILSGQQPYYNIPQNDALVALALAQQRKPDRPKSQALIGRDEYWDFILQCWSKAQERPNAEEAHKSLIRLREEALRAQ
ncbi:hypothetical protein HWV62_16126 [Athelia sp. TMB]|nr:hypothetical protein HWV62_10565 [Athelia sp. TMB]KAF7984273.1 hypothetical protein HWV62_16126 [Athelia sp. TMB]